MPAFNAAIKFRVQAPYMTGDAERVKMGLTLTLQWVKRPHIGCAQASSSAANAA